MIRDIKLYESKSSDIIFGVHNFTDGCYFFYFKPYIKNSGGFRYLCRCLGGHQTIEEAQFCHEAMRERINFTVNNIY